MITQELNQLKNKFYNSNLSTEEMINFWTDIKDLIDTFESYIDELVIRKGNDEDDNERE